MPDLSSERHWERVYAQATAATRRGRLRARLGRVVSRKLDAVLARFLDRTGKVDPHVLELGCAPGRMLEQIHRVRPGARLAGIDYTEHGLAVARQRLQARGIDATLHFGDARAVEIPERFDLVVSFGLVEHFDDPVPMLASHARFCGPGGWVGVTIPNLAPPIVERLATRFAPATMATHNLAIMRPGALAEAMTKAGLGEVTSGGAGGPNLSAAIEPGIPLAWLYRRLARTWNLAAAVSPFDPFWHQTWWALGRVPGAA